MTRHIGAYWAKHDQNLVYASKTLYLCQGSDNNATLCARKKLPSVCSKDEQPKNNDQFVVLKMNTYFGAITKCQYKFNSTQLN